MAWIFQGNPKKFEIDEYVARYPELIYWYTPRHASEIQVGDRVFLWRSGVEAGAIAVGSVVEKPVLMAKVKHPEALGTDLWSVDRPDPNEVKTGIRLEDIRLTTEEGMLSRESVKAHPVMARSTIIRMPNGTVFRLDSEEVAVLESLWGLGVSPNPSLTLGMTEGERKLRSHYRRERSGKLRNIKLKQFLKVHGKYFCEICGETMGIRYPPTLDERIYEVHHRKPLAQADAPVQTTLDDLALLCANCHRSVHASAEVDRNYSALVKHFGNER